MGGPSDEVGIVFYRSAWALRIIAAAIIGAVYVFLNTPFVRVEKGHIAAARYCFEKRERNTKLEVPVGFDLERFQAVKGGWTATLRRKCSERCDAEFGAYSLAYVSARKEISCTTEGCRREIYRQTH